jgi:hypothetical protein
MSDVLHIVHSLHTVHSLHMYIREADGEACARGSGPSSGQAPVYGLLGAARALRGWALGGMYVLSVANVPNVPNVPLHTYMPGHTYIRGWPC